MNFEVGPVLIGEVVREAVQTSSERPQGINVQAVTLEQVGVGEDERNLIAIQIRPWKDVLGRRIDSPMTYVLRMEIVPYAITYDAIDSESVRRQILGTTGGGADFGAVVRLEFYDMYRLGSREKVFCTSPDFGPVDQAVLRAVYEGFAVQTGQISTSTSSTVVDGFNTKFRDQLAPSPQSDASQWEIYAKSGMEYVGRVAAVPDNLTLTLQQPATATLVKEGYVAVRRPIVLPIAELAKLTAYFYYPVLFRVGINVASRGELKIGLDVQTPPGGSLATMPFTSQPSIGSTDDWKITLGAKYLAVIAGKALGKALDEADSALDLTDLRIDFDREPPSPISVVLNGRVTLGIPIEIDAPVTPKVRLGNDDKPYLLAHLAHFPGFSLPFAEALVAIGEALKEVYLHAGGCEDAVGPGLQHAFGNGPPLEAALEDDILYATSVDADKTHSSISLAGRSRFIDELLLTDDIPPRRSPIQDCQHP
jgi:hypothetical protein